MICTCPGGDCNRKTDCRRFLEHKHNEWGEKFPLPRYRDVNRTDSTGRPLRETQQVCEKFLPRESQ